MVMLKSFEDARRVLADYVPAAGGMRKAYKLDRMRQLMAGLGDPQNKLKIVHVAGTSGKTSTCYYIAALLQSAGQRVGLTISPHVDEINERIQINLSPLPEDEFCYELSKFLNLIEQTSIQPTYFELLIAFAYWEFVRQKVDYAVVEVGLGGLLDGTNVATRRGKICVITDIGLDHTDVLGTELAGIATQKAGIIQPGSTVFSYRHNDEIMSVVREIASEKAADLYELESPDMGELPMDVPLFQKRNWFLAERVAQYVLERDKVQQPTSDVWRETARTHIPARMEIISLGTKTVILDGAHNAQKMQVLMASLKDRFLDQKFSVLLSLVDGKDLDVSGVLAEIKPLTKSLTVTSFGTQQDLPKISINPRIVAASARKLGFETVEVISKPEEAFHSLVDTAEDFVLVCGSFYLLNHIRPLIFRL